MIFDYEAWKTRHVECVEKISRLCDFDESKDFVKCNSALCVMNCAMQDIYSYFERSNASFAELCFLIRNIDVIISGILDINNIIFGIGLNKQENAIERCFTDKSSVCKFRTLRSQILAHPVDTHYINKDGELEIIYLEDVQPYNPNIDGFIIEKKCDYVKRMCKPISNTSYFEPLTLDEDIIPVINTIIKSLKLLSDSVEHLIKQTEEKMSLIPLEINRNSMQDYIISLDRELEKRYPAAVENIFFGDGSEERYSIVFECIDYFNASFIDETQKKYCVFLEYIKSELNKIETDLQNMRFDEDQYFLLLYNPDFASSLSYEKQKMEYLRRSKDTTYTEEYIGNDTQSNSLWGIKCFRDLMPYINEYIPVDVNVSDKELYCQYVAAVYLSNLDEIK